MDDNRERFSCVSTIVVIDLSDRERPDEGGSRVVKGPMTLIIWYDLLVQLSYVYSFHRRRNCVLKQYFSKKNPDSKENV